MKISKNWLNKHIGITKTNAEIVDGLTNLGLECNVVGSISYDRIVVGYVDDCYKHPNADRLSVCIVKIGDNEENSTIVCGAPNVKQGIFVAVAKIGACVGPDKIKKTKIRDIESNGMICSGKELGINENDKGIMVLDKYEIGLNIKEALNLELDTIFDFDITPNRGDCFSHLGIARELAVLENKKINTFEYNISPNQFKTSKMINVNIKDKDFCKRYACRIIRNIKVQDSPGWLKKSLESIGQKSINSIVDIANYVMFDSGQPLHAFDYDKISGNEIVIKLSNSKQELMCINNLKYKLSSGDLIISDKDKPIAIAGIIGGLNSHVTVNTKTILIESAIFDDINLRRTSKIHDVSTESSKRFERGLDVNGSISALNQFIDLVLAISGGEVSEDIIDIYPNIDKEVEINFNLESCNDFLGTNISKENVISIFNNLSIEVLEEKNNIKCIIPSYRNDIKYDVDLYEEVARVYGYNNIPSSSRFNISLNTFCKDELCYEDKIRNYLSINGLSEHYSNSFCNYKEILLSKVFNNDSSEIQIANPLSSDMKFLRINLIPGILKSLSFNVKRNLTFSRIFEIGSTNNYNETLYNSTKETRMLCIGYMGNNILTWRGSQKYDIFNIKTDLINMFKFLNKNKIDIIESSSNEKLDFSLNIMYMDKQIGYIYGLNNHIKDEYDIKEEVVLVNINLDLLFSNETKNSKYEKPSPYPSSKRDISILIDDKISNKVIEELIIVSSSSILKKVQLFDIYKGDKIDMDKKSLAYSLEYQAKDRTLKDKEIDKDIQLVIDNLKNKLNAIQR